MTPADLERRHLRSRLGAASIVLVGVSALVPVIELHRAAVAISILAAILAAVLQTAHVTRELIGQAPAVVVALIPSAVGALDRDVPRFSALAGGVLLFMGAELARVSLDQRTAVPEAADPPGEAVTASLIVAGLGAIAGAVVLAVSLLHLPSAAVVAAVGAGAAISVAAVLAHPRSMLGAAVVDAEDAVDGSDSDDQDAVSPA